MELTHIIVEVAKALGGSFKLVTLAPKTLREMTHCSEGLKQSWKTPRQAGGELVCEM